ncbi:MAG: 50S ribosomal protein L24e [Nanoarchaeota archaeon]|nr:50S ribosomal protein L24e [Nanoarchaeota archaeon]
MNCSFCSKTISPGTGKMYVKTDGKIFYFCSMKCEKNMLLLKRKPRQTRWTGEAQKAKKEEMATKKEEVKKAPKKETKKK